MTTAPAALDRALWALRGYDTTALGTIGPDGPHVAGVFFAPERTERGFRLLLSVLRSSRKLEDIAADPRVAFMCSPGNPSRWIQGNGVAEIVEEGDEERRDELFRHLVAHAAGARSFIENLPVAAVVVTVRRLKIVEEATTPPLLFDFGTS